MSGNKHLGAYTSINIKCTGNKQLGGYTNIYIKCTFTEIGNYFKLTASLGFICLFDF